MKILTLGIISVILFAGNVQAQDAKKAFSNAKKAQGIYNLDPQTNKAKLGEAKHEIDQAINGTELIKESKTWQLRGEIYNEIATQIVAARQLSLGTSKIPSVDDPAGEAFSSFSKALELAEKKYETKDALKGIRQSQSNLYNMGIFAYEDQNYELAYSNFLGVIEAHKILKANGGESSLNVQDDYFNQLYIAGLAALNANRVDEAAPLFQELYENNFDKPVIYEALYKIKKEELGAEAAYQYLAIGREKYPDDVSLLFAEINHFLSINKLDELVGKLETAIQKEPNNISLYATLGNVYDNLFQKELNAGNEEKAQEYFDNAKKYYNDALIKAPDYFDAVYSLGSLYYNKAASKTTELNALADDFSAEGLELYEAKKAEIFELFDQALPYFQKAESMNPNDLNTLIALKEIYARKDQLDISTEFNIRLNRVQSGETINIPYFNE